MKFYSSKKTGTIVSIASLSMSLALSSFSALAAAGGSDRGGGDLRKLDSSTIEMLLKSDVLKSAMLNYLNSIKLDQVEDAQVKNTLSRISIDSLRADILTRGNYKSGSQCRDSYNNEVPASAKIGDEGGEICFDTNLISEQLKERSVEEGFIRLAALAFHEHVHHFQSRWTSTKKNEDEAYRVADYVLLTAKTVQMPSLKWSVAAPNIPIGQSIDESPLDTLAHGTKIQIPLNAVIPAQDSRLFLGWSSGGYHLAYNYQIGFSCTLRFPSSNENRVLNGTMEMELDHVDQRFEEQAHGGPSDIGVCSSFEKIIGNIKINGVLRSEVQMDCVNFRIINRYMMTCSGVETPVALLREIIEKAGGTLTPSSAVQF